MGSFFSSLGILIYATLLYTPPLLFAALGSCFSENSGVVNIGIEGMMTLGAFVGAATSYAIGSPLLGFLLGGLAGALLGALLALATVSLGADQTIAGTAINFLAPGIALLISKSIFNSSDTPSLSQDKMIPMLFNNAFKDVHSGSGMFFKNLLNVPITSYLVFVVLILVWCIFYKTPYGMHLRACGEHPKACDTLGIDVIKTRYSAVITSGFLSGLGGACVTMSIMNQFRPIAIVGQGFIAIAAVLFGKFRPQGALVACLLFGFCSGLKVVIGQSSVISAQLISMIPYVVTIVILILFVGKSRVPSASGKPYYKSR